VPFCYFIFFSCAFHYFIFCSCTWIAMIGTTRERRDNSIQIDRRTCFSKHFVSLLKTFFVCLFNHYDITILLISRKKTHSYLKKFISKKIIVQFPKTLYLNSVLHDPFFQNRVLVFLYANSLLNHLWHANKIPYIQMRDMSLWNLNFTNNNLLNALKFEAT
jgi:hypothetical protein